MSLPHHNKKQVPITSPLPHRVIVRATEALRRINDQDAAINQIRLTGGLRDTELISTPICLSYNETNAIRIILTELLGLRPAPVETVQPLPSINGLRLHTVN